MATSPLSEPRHDGASRFLRHLGSVLRGSLLVATLTAAPAVGEEAPPLRWRNVDRVVAFADVHGAYAELTALLQATGIVDAQARWSGGKAHVVSLGDLLARGDDSRKVMDLLMRLQQEAAAAGGRLHVVIGNHEAMNVLGDLRYVEAGEYLAYASDEDPALRQTLRLEFQARHPEAAEADFQGTFPPGYFAHRQLLGPGGRYGRWLLSLPAAIVINDTIYMHGGPSALLQGRSLEELDRDYRRALAEYVDAEAALRKAGLLQFEDSYGRRPELAGQRLQALPAGPDRQQLEALVTRFVAADENALLGPDGPNWYRGTAFCNECAEADVLKPYLQLTGARRLVVGHTVARHGTVVSRFDGSVVKLDAGMKRDVYGGRPAALVSDGSGSHVVYGDAPAAPMEVPPEPLYLSSQVLGEDDVEDLLAKGSIETVDTCAPGVQNVRVTANGRKVNAVFEAAPTDTIQREIAAYRLDRLLGLGLVPATVAREHEGRRGILQGRPVGWISERDRQNARAGTLVGLVCQTITAAPQAEPARRPVPTDGKPPRMPTGGWCDVAAQYQLAYAFDALIENKGRHLDRYLYDLDTSTLFLSGHDAAFSSTQDVLKRLEPQLVKTGAEMRRRLQGLDADRIAAALPGMLDKRQVRALLERRDRILQLPAPAARPGG